MTSYFHAWAIMEGDPDSFPFALGIGRGSGGFMGKPRTNILDEATGAECMRSPVSSWTCGADLPIVGAEVFLPAFAEDFRLLPVLCLLVEFPFQFLLA